MSISFASRTLPKGAAEFEQWVTLRALRNDKVGQDNFNRWELREEFEYGITDRDTISLYLNTAAESIPPLCVGEALQAYWHDKLRGMKGRDFHFKQVEECREVAARMISLKPAEVSFCSCSSEAYNLLATALNLQPTDEVVVTDLDFPAGATPWLTANTRPQTRVWKASQGELLVDDLLPLLNARTQLVQVSLVSFYNGHRLAWAAFRDAVRKRRPSVHVVDLARLFPEVPQEPTYHGLSW